MPRDRAGLTLVQVVQGGGPIEVDASGNFFVAGFLGAGNIAKVTPQGVATHFVNLSASGRNHPSF
jgi:hypothetical protein